MESGNEEATGSGKTPDSDSGTPKTERRFDSKGLVKDGQYGFSSFLESFEPVNELQEWDGTELQLTLAEVTKEVQRIHPSDDPPAVYCKEWAGYILKRHFNYRKAKANNEKGTGSSKRGPSKKEDAQPESKTASTSQDVQGPREFQMPTMDALKKDLKDFTAELDRVLLTSVDGERPASPADIESMVTEKPVDGQSRLVDDGLNGNIGYGDKSAILRGLAELENWIEQRGKHWLSTPSISPLSLERMFELSERTFGDVEKFKFHHAVLQRVRLDKSHLVLPLQPILDVLHSLYEVLGIDLVVSSLSSTNYREYCPSRMETEINIYNENANKLHLSMVDSIMELFQGMWDRMDEVNATVMELEQERQAFSREAIAASVVYKCAIGSDTFSDYFSNKLADLKASMKQVKNAKKSKGDPDLYSTSRIDTVFEEFVESIKESIVSIDNDLIKAYVAKGQGWIDKLVMKILEHTCPKGSDPNKIIASMRDYQTLGGADFGFDKDSMDTINCALALQSTYQVKFDYLRPVLVKLCEVLNDELEELKTIWYHTTLETYHARLENSSGKAFRIKLKKLDNFTKEIKNQFINAMQELMNSVPISMICNNLFRAIATLQIQTEMEVGQKLWLAFGENIQAHESSRQALYEEIVAGLDVGRLELVGLLCEIFLIEFCRLRDNRYSLTKGLELLKISDEDKKKAQHGAGASVKSDKKKKKAKRKEKSGTASGTQTPIPPYEPEKTEMNDEIMEDVDLDETAAVQVPKTNNSNTNNNATNITNNKAEMPREAIPSNRPITVAHHTIDLTDSTAQQLHGNSTVESSKSLHGADGKERRHERQNLPVSQGTATSVTSTVTTSSTTTTVPTNSSMAAPPPPGDWDTPTNSSLASTPSKQRAETPIDSSILSADKWVSESGAEVSATLDSEQVPRLRISAWL